MPRRNSIPKPIIRFVLKNNCDAKRKYPTENAAIQTAEHQMLLNYDLELSVYKCDNCNKWHLTRNKNTNI